LRFSHGKASQDKPCGLGSTEELDGEREMLGDAETKKKVKQTKQAIGSSLNDLVTDVICGEREIETETERRPSPFPGGDQACR
jgi:hypothetical protein